MPCVLNAAMIAIQVLMVEPPLNERAQRQEMAGMMFETFKVLLRTLVELSNKGKYICKKMVWYSMVHVAYAGSTASLPTCRWKVFVRVQKHVQPASCTSVCSHVSPGGDGFTYTTATAVAGSDIYLPRVFDSRDEHR